METVIVLYFQRIQEKSENELFHSVSSMPRQLTPDDELLLIGIPCLNMRVF